MTIQVKVKVNKKFGDHVPGTIVEIDCDENYKPLNHIWRRRFKDAEIDNCCEIVEPEKSKSKSKPKPESEAKSFKKSTTED